MKYIFLLFFLFTISQNSFSQGTDFSINNYSFKINNSELTVFKNDSLLYEKKFSNPSPDSVDLDNDGVSEFEVIDSTVSSESVFYTFYVYSTLDSFFLADSIYSGITIPYEAETDDVQGKIIVTGNPFFDHFNGGNDTKFSPINCWKYESGVVYDVNDEVYDLFMNENDDIIDYLDNYFQSKESNCINSREVLGAIAAGYANYINAGEETSADKFLSTYYFCLDKDKFKQDLNSELKR